MAQFDLFENMYIEKALLGVEDITTGFGQENQTRAGMPKTPVTQVNASHFQGVLTFKKLQQLNDLDTTYLGLNATAIVQETGQVYFFDGANWNTSGSVVVKLSTLDELKTLKKDQTTAFITDPLRGGFFVYHQNLSSVNNNGTIFNGWVRLFSGLADVKWFGAKGDGTTDDYAAFNNALNSGLPILVSEGTYLTARPLTLPAGGYLEGQNGGKLKWEADITCLTIKANAIVKNVIFEGRRSNSSQVGIKVDGGPAKNAVSNTRVEGCTFTQIGGVGYSLVNVANLSNFLTGCSFTSCESGVEFSHNGGGYVVTNCSFNSCDTGLTTQGFQGSVSECYFSQNGLSISFISGAVDESVLVSNCYLHSRGTAALQMQSYSGSATEISNCRFDGNVNLVSTNNTTFNQCDFTNDSVSFNNARENTFLDCIMKGSNVNNASVRDYNYFVDSRKDTNSSDAAHLLVWNTSDTYLNSNNVTQIKFNQVQFKAPYLPNIVADQVYDSSTGIFDFTNIKSPRHRDTITCKIQMATDCSVQNAQMYLYKIDNPSDDVSSNLSQDRLYAWAETNNWSLNTGLRLFNFMGQIPRGKYKLMVVTTESSKRIYGNLTQTFRGTGKITCRAEFWGI